MGAAPRWGKGEVWAPYLAPPPLETRVWGGWERGPGCGNNPHGLQCAARRRTRSVSFGEQRELGLKGQQSYASCWPKPKVWSVTPKLVIRAKACFVCLFSFQKLAATSTGYPLENPCASWGYGRPDPPVTVPLLQGHIHADGVTDPKAPGSSLMGHPFHPAPSLEASGSLIALGFYIFTSTSILTFC